MVGLQWFGTVLATITAFQNGLWDALKRDLLRRKIPATFGDGVELVAVTPFDVIWLQVRAGAVLGGVLAAPTAAYLGRRWLRRRGYWPRADASPGSIGTAALGGGIVLFVAGVAAGYEVLFPAVLDVLADGVVGDEALPRHSVVLWAELAVALSLSTGVAATVPFVAGTLARGDALGPTVRRDAVVLAAGLAVVGLVVWWRTPVVQAVWNGPLLAGLLAAGIVARLAPPGSRGERAERASG